jgi:uncharacterized protein (DUF39 family)
MNTITSKLRTYEEINDRIAKGEAVVVTAEEVINLVEDEGIKRAAREVDVVTTGTFSPMCSSGVFLNFGHADPPIRMQKIWLNDVPAHGGLAAVDTYLGATNPSETIPDYGGAHVIEDLIRGKEVTLKATSGGTDCYPRKDITTDITLLTINEAILFNPRNCYQNYNAAVNTTHKKIRTYMGTLLPDMGNVSYATSGQLSPLFNDPTFRSIGMGTRIFLCGAQGHIAWHGTQHRPSVVTRDGKTIVGGATLSVVGDLKQMSPDFLRAAAFPGYGISMFVGIGIPIPILDEEMLKATAVTDADLYTQVIDYSYPHRQRPTLGTVSYGELRSGTITLKDKEIRTSPLSSYAKAREIAQTLKKEIEESHFLLQRPAWTLPREGVNNHLE